ncbi:MAG: PilZ domain-containing protein [Terriglobales bacterium]
MGRRSYKRLRIEVPVTVSGLDMNGNFFTQSATTVDISARGLCVRYISCLRGQRGQPVQVKYKHHSARYLVAWIGENGTSFQGLIGLEGLDANYLFADHLPPDFACGIDPHADSYVVPSADSCVVPGDVTFSVSPGVADRCKGDRRQEERRRHPRFNCSGTASIWEQGHELASSARVNEISLGGCYIETMSPLRLATCVRLELSINHRSISLEGMVRNSQPNYGMGIEFIKIAAAEAEKLQSVIGEVSGAVPAEAQAPPASPPASPAVGQLEDAVVRWFGSHDALTLQEFRELKEEVAHVRHDFTHAT